MPFVGTAGKPALHILLMTFVVASCSDTSNALLEPDPAAMDASAFAVSQGGAGGIYFLPPLTHSAFSGVFSPTRDLEVQVCAGVSADPCATPVAAFDMTRDPGEKQAQVIRMVLEDEHYIVNWETRSVASGEYRIFVLEHGATLAFIDVLVVQNAKATQEARRLGIPVVNGSVPIKLRAEETIQEEPAPCSVQANGLCAEYYDWRTTALDFSAATLILRRVDATIDFNDPTFDPANDVFNIGQTDRFMARWTGFIQPQHSESYTVCVTTDDGARLWIDGVQLFEAWFDQEDTEHCATLSMTAAQKYPILLEWYEDEGNATAELRWQSASQPKQIVPASALFVQ